MEHSYEEIRSISLDILAGREKSRYPLEQYVSLGTAIAEILQLREVGKLSERTARLSQEDENTFLEVFWELFRQGIITLGINDANREFPFFRVSRFGKNILANQNFYFFHDVSSYSKLLTDEIPNINDVTHLYLKEAMQSFRSGCILSSTVMLGVAAEHTFLLLLEELELSEHYSKIFKNVFEEKTILQKLNKFRNVLDMYIKKLPSEIKEDLDTNFLGIISIIRNFRNQAGHPTGKIIAREQAYILLQLFIPYCKKIYELKKYFKKTKI